MRSLRIFAIAIIAKLLEDKVLEEDEEYEYMPIERFGGKGVSTVFFPIEGAEPVSSLLADQIKSLQIEELKQILSAVPQEIEIRQAPNRSPPKPENTSVTQAHEVSSILHN